MKICKKYVFTYFANFEKNVQSFIKISELGHAQIFIDTIGKM